MLLNSTGSILPGGGAGGQQAVQTDAARPPSYILGTLIRTFLAVTVAAAVYEAATQLAFPHITLLQSHAITVFVFGVGSTLAVYLALRSRLELQVQVQTQLAERERAEEELRQTSETLKTLVKASPLAIIAADRNLIVQTWNAAAERLLGWTEAEVVGKPLATIPETRREAFLAMFERTQKGGTVEPIETQRVRKDGSLVDVITSTAALRDASGEITGYMGILTDITERKRAEEALSHERDLLRALMDNVPDYIYFKDRESRFLRISRAHARAFGLSDPAQALGKTDFDFFTAEHAQQAYDDEQEVIRSGKATAPQEEKETWPDGRVTWVSTIKMPFRDAQGAIIGTFGVSRDITERKRAEEALHQSEEKYRSIVLNIPDVIWTLDSQGGIVFVSPNVEELSGYTTEEVMEGGLVFFLTTVHPDDVRAVVDTMQAAFGGEPKRDVEFRGRRKDGRWIWVHARSVRAFEKDGVQYLQGLMTDVTERKRVEGEVQVAKEAAETASRAKSEFLANMSHEIRTPMNGIIGMTELALDTPLSSEQRDYLTMVKDSADSLLSLINDILDFSKIEAGKLGLDSAEFNLHDVLANTLRLLSVRASQKGLEVAWSPKTGVPERVIGDAGRVRQVIVNLVGNAIKFTEQGEVVVGVEVESRREEDIQLHFTVRDTGIGITPEKQKMIFEAFTQADTSMTRKYGGTGLGLTISSRLVQMMEGKIWLQSTLGEGSTFHFTARFGLPKGEKAEALLRQAVSLRDLPVLVVDDNSTNRRILESMLKHWLMVPELARSGAEGLSALERAASAGTPFPLVLLDAQMPEMDGFSLAERIKQNPRLAGATIMMLTSAGQRGDVARCRELGIAVYLIKPIRQSELQEAILAALGKSLAAGSPATVITRHTLREERRKLQILLVEDNAVNQQLAVRLLEKRGHIVTVASDGSEALALLRQSRFDLALMDVQMPVMDGFEATAAIRDGEASSGNHLPIIAMTAHTMQGDRERCLAAGMDAYISKPIQADELTEIVERIAGSVSPQMTTASTSGGVLDRGEALSRLQGDKELLADLAGVFLKDYPSQLADIRNAITRGDLAGLERAAHSLKGSVANFGARRTFDVAFELEKTARSGDLAECSRLSAALETEMEALKPELLRLGTDEA